jgi:hypothetical protein
MFEEFGPANPPQPPAGALEQAMTRGRKIRRQRRAGVVSAVALSAAVIGGFALAGPLHSNQSLVVPAEKPTPPPDYSPIPVSPAASAAAKHLDFGTLTKITTTGGVITLYLDRAHFYVGAEAKAHNKGETPLDDYVFDDTDGKKIFTFTLDPKASIQAEANLQKDQENTDERVKLTRAQFVQNMTAMMTQNAGQTDPDSIVPVYVWLRHAGGPDGPVTAIADQFVS